jgi:hypothetical protein
MKTPDKASQDISDTQSNTSQPRSNTSQRQSDTSEFQSSHHCYPFKHQSARVKLCQKPVNNQCQAEHGDAPSPCVPPTAAACQAPPRMENIQRRQASQNPRETQSKTPTSLRATWCSRLLASCSRRRLGPLGLLPAMAASTVKMAPAASGMYLVRLRLRCACSRSASAFAILTFSHDNAGSMIQSE